MTDADYTLLSPNDKAALHDLLRFGSLEKMAKLEHKTVPAIRKSVSQAICALKSQILAWQNPHQEILTLTQLVKELEEISIPTTATQRGQVLLCHGIHRVIELLRYTDRQLLELDDVSEQAVTLIKRVLNNTASISIPTSRNLPTMTNITFIHQIPISRDKQGAGSKRSRKISRTSLQNQDNQK